MRPAPKWWHTLGVVLMFVSGCLVCIAAGSSDFDLRIGAIFLAWVISHISGIYIGMFAERDGWNEKRKEIAETFE